MKKTVLSLAISVIIIFSSPAREVTNSRFGFTINIPNEFQDFPEGKIRPETIYSFIRPTLTSQRDLTIHVERLRGTIGREPLPPDGANALKQTLPPGSTVEVYRSQWNKFQVEGVELKMPHENINVISRSAQIPLKKEAIQVVVTGPSIADSEISNVLKNLLGSLQGQSNWLTNSERVFLALHALKELVVAIIIAVFIAKAITIGTRKKKQSQRV
jgi:hypothetical protein